MSPPMRGMLSTLKRADLNDQVYASLKERLATRKLAPGEKLSLQELRDRLRHLPQPRSRTPSPAW